MPQFNLVDATPQIIWLALVFLILYLSISAMLPRVGRVIEDRKARISGDLAAAEAAKAAAEGASSSGSDALQQARGRALSVTGIARDEAQKKTAQTLAAADSRLEAWADEAQKSLSSARAAAMAELDQVAAEATVDLVRRISGIELSNDEAASAVRKVAA